MPSIDLKNIGQKPQKTSKPGPASQPGVNDLMRFLNRDIDFSNGQLSDKKKESFYLELSALLEAGIDFRTAINLISEEQENQRDRITFDNIQQMVIKGEAISQAMEGTKRFSPYEIFSVQIGEETGKIVEILKELSSFYHQRIKERRKLTAAMAYPVVIISVSIGAVFFMLRFVVPMFADLFKRFGGELPWLTQQIVSASNALERYFPYIILLVVSFIVFVKIFKERDEFKRISAMFIGRIPFFGNLVKKTYLTRFCNAMRLLISAKIPLLRAIDLAGQMIGYYPITSSLKEVEKDILMGTPLHASLQRHPMYPVKMIQMIKVGEETNQLDLFFKRLAEQYSNEVEHKTSTMSHILEPLIMVFLGIVVGMILIAMYLPLFQMSSTFD